jgi:hypothetical protein
MIGSRRRGVSNQLAPRLAVKDFSVRPDLRGLTFDHFNPTSQN